jgi:CubicO group peptidase (beta-lactamase class C family)
LTFDQFLRQRLFEPLGMDNTWFNVPEKEKPRIATIYNQTAERIAESRPPAPDRIAGLFLGCRRPHGICAEDYLQFAQMLCNGGQLNGKRILSPWTVDLMLSNNVGELFEGQIGRAPKGRRIRTRR